MIITDSALTTPSYAPRPVSTNTLPPPAHRENLPLIGAHLRTTWCGDAIIPEYPDDAVLRSVPCNTTPDLTRCLRGSNWESFITNNGARPSTWVSPSLTHKTDQFYLLCQRHRDAYKDRSGTKHPLDMFAQHERWGHCPPRLFQIYTRSPTYYIAYKQPYVIPLSMGRTLRIPDKPGRALVRRHDGDADVKRKF